MSRISRLFRRPAKWAMAAVAALPLAVLLPAALPVAALPLAGCGCCGGGYYGYYYGNIFASNRTDTTTPEQALTFRIAAFGASFTGDLLGAPLDPGVTHYAGYFREEYYDAESDMFGGDLVEWFDRWVGAATDTYFDIF